MKWCDSLREPIKVACTPKETSCIVPNLFAELSTPCDICEALRGEDFVLCGSLSDGQHAIIKMTDYGFEYFGPIETLDRIRGTRCLIYGATDTSEKD